MANGIELEPTGDTWITQDLNLVWDTGIYLAVRTRFDGSGNSIVRFVVRHHGKETTYEKYDSAVSAYNLNRAKQPAQEEA